MQARQAAGNAGGAPVGRELGGGGSRRRVADGEDGSGGRRLQEGDVDGGEHADAEDGHGRLEGELVERTGLVEAQVVPQRQQLARGHHRRGTRGQLLAFRLHPYRPLRPRRPRLVDVQLADGQSQRGSNAWRGAVRGAHREPGVGTACRRVAETHLQFGIERLQLLPGGLDLPLLCGASVFGGRVCGRGCLGQGDVRGHARGEREDRAAKGVHDVLVLRRACDVAAVDRRDALPDVCLPALHPQPAVRTLATHAADPPCGSAAGRAVAGDGSRP